MERKKKLPTSSEDMFIPRAPESWQFPGGQTQKDVELGGMIQGPEQCCCRWVSSTQPTSSSSNLTHHPEGQKREQNWTQ
jgi:hypothetical protein